jgi:hypothetical protein
VLERISFVDSMRWLVRAKPANELPELVVNLERPDRVEPRGSEAATKAISLDDETTIGIA